MFCPKKLQLNKFVAVACPKPKDLFSRLGKRVPPSTGSNDGTEYSDIVDFTSSNLDRLSNVAREENLRLYNEYQNTLPNPSDSPESNSADE